MSESIRCFLAIELPQGLKQRIDQLRGELQSLAPKVKWVKAGSIHITLKFLGSQTPEMVDGIIQTLLTANYTFSYFSLSTTHFGAFPNQKRPRVFWLGIQSTPSQPLFTLQQTIEERLANLGIEKEQRRFSPHLTLGRVKVQQDFSPLYGFIKENPFEPFRFPVHEFVLMRSILKSQGAEYRPIHTFRLSK